MKSMGLLDDLLRMEDEKQFWYPDINGLKVWPLVRGLAFRTVLHEHYQLVGDPRTQKWRYFDPAVMAKYVRSAAFMLSPKVKREAYSTLFFTATTSRYATEDKRYSYDRLYRDYLALAENPLLIQLQIFRGQLGPDRDYEHNTFSENALWMLAYARAQTMRLSNTVRQQIVDFAEHITGLLNIPQVKPAMIDQIALYYKSYPLVQRIIEQNIVPRFRSKVVFMHTASLLQRKAYVIKALHEMGCQVAELQHGTAVTAINFAFRYQGDCLKNPDHPCRLYLPDYYLTFGDHFTANLQLPAQTFTVGSPYLNGVVDAVQGKSSIKPRQILVISQHTATQKIVDMALELAQAMPDYHFIYKLHPLELHLEHLCAPLKTLPNVEVVGRANVYQLIAESPIIVGYYSTVISETAAFDDKRVFVLDNTIVTLDIGEKFKTVPELVEKIADPSTGRSQHNPADFWARDWKNNMAAFMKRYNIPSL